MTSLLCFLLNEALLDSGGGGGCSELIGAFEWLFLSENNRRLLYFVRVLACMC